MSKTGNVFSRYIQQFDWSKIADDLFSKLVSLLLLFILFYIVKKILHLSVTKIIAPSLKLSKQDVARQKTITRLIENLLNYVLYFLLIYWVLSIIAANAPTKNDPSCSLYKIEATFGKPSTVSSIIANF